MPITSKTETTAAAMAAAVLFISCGGGVGGGGVDHWRTFKGGGPLVLQIDVTGGVKKGL